MPLIADFSCGAEANVDEYEKTRNKQSSNLKGGNIENNWFMVKNFL
jgi:hypothetical protein